MQFTFTRFSFRTSWAKYPEQNL